MRSPLDNLTIVLVRTKIPANIGAVSRAMMNTGLRHLSLVEPPQDWQVEAVKRASGATGPIDSARIFDSLADAVANHGLVIGTSRHTGKQRRNIRTVRESAGEIVSRLAANRIALVFGREVNGLDRADLTLCNELVQIPSSDEFPSLNLSHAVMVVAYELFLAAGESAPFDDRELAPASDTENFYAHLQETLEQAGFLTSNNREHMMLSLRQVFGRARLDLREVNILRGILRLLSKDTTP